MLRGCDELAALLQIPHSRYHGTSPYKTKEHTSQHIRRYPTASNGVCMSDGTFALELRDPNPRLTASKVNQANFAFNFSIAETTSSNLTNL